MKTKLILIALAAAAFGWGFATLVRQSDQTIRPESARLACQEWGGGGCARTGDR